MKKISMILGGAILVLAAGCQKLGEGVTPDNTDAPVVGEGQKVELFATLPVTRTTLSSDFKLVWNKSDQIAVFNAPTGTEGYSANLKFVIDEDATGKFAAAEGVEVPFEDGVNYDWFVCCPYRETNGNIELDSPKGQSTDDGYFPIGLQTQDGYNNPMHISSSDIMVGKSLNTRTPVVSLKHLGVLHKFTVTNESDKPTTITKLTLDGGDNILFGAFWIDLTADDPAIDVTKASSNYSKRDLNVNNGEVLEVGESADFYMMTAPFTLNAGETFKVTIETSTGTHVVEKTASADIEFKAGTYNTANLVYDYKTPDYLYYETFDGSQTLAAVRTDQNDIRTDRWGNYDKTGLSVYDGVIANVTYEDESGSTLSKYVATTALPNMKELYMCLWDNGTITVKGIKLHGKTKLNLSFIHDYNNSEVTVDYSIDNGENWKEIGKYKNSSASVTRNTDFELEQSSEYIWLRFTGTGTTHPRIDNIKLTWQEE